MQRQIIKEKLIDRKNKGYYQKKEVFKHGIIIYRLYNKNNVYINSSFDKFDI